MQLGSVSIPMICHDNIVFSTLYRGDVASLHAIIQESAQRLGAPFAVPWDRTKLRCLFILLLEKDMLLKELVLTGTGAVGKLDPRKAACLFLALRPEVIDRWLYDERRDTDDFVQSARNLYLCV